MLFHGCQHLLETHWFEEKILDAANRHGKGMFCQGKFKKRARRYQRIKKMRGRGVRRISAVNVHGGLEGIIAVDDLIDLLAEQMADLAALITTEQRWESQKRS